MTHRPTIDTIICAGGPLSSELELEHSYLPALSAAFYLNFGVVGIVIGHFVLARLCGWIDRRHETSQTAVIQLFWSFFSILLLIGLLVFGFLTGLLVFACTPLILAAVAPHLSIHSLIYLLNGVKKGSTT